MEENEVKKWLTQASKFFVIAIFLFFSWLWAGRSEEAWAINTQINYQGKLTNASGVTVADGSYNIKIVIYDSATGGTCQYTLRGSCASPTAAATTVTTGIFSINLGDTSASHNALSSSLFNSTTTLYLGVTINTDSEMTPRKALTAAPYAFTSLNLGGASSTLFVGTSTLPSSIVGYFENPSTASASNKILVIRGNSSQAGNLMDLQNNSGTSLAYITAGGSVRTSSTLLVTGDATFYATSSVRQLNTIRYADQFCSTPGTLDDTCVQNAINDCPANGCEVFVPAGTYNVANPITLRSGVKVRGAGKNNTVINIIAGHTGTPFTSNAFRATGTVDTKTTLSATADAANPAGPTNKTRNVTLTSTTGFAVGDTVWIQGGAGNTSSSANQQGSVIESIAGSTVTLKDSLLFTYASGAAFQEITPVRNIAISDMTISTTSTNPREAIHLAIVHHAIIERIRFEGVLFGVFAVTSGDSPVASPNDDIIIQDNEFLNLQPLAGNADVPRAVYVFGNNFRILNNQIKGILHKGMEIDNAAYAIAAHNTFLGDATSTATSVGLSFNDSVVRSSIVNNHFTNMNTGIQGIADPGTNPIAFYDSNISDNIFTSGASVSDHISLTATVDLQRSVIANNVIVGGATNGIAVFSCTPRDNIIVGNKISGPTNSINGVRNGAVCGSVTGVPTITTSNNLIANNHVNGVIFNFTGTGDKVVTNLRSGNPSATSTLSLADGDVGFIFDSASSTPLTTSTILLSFRNAGTEKARINSVGGLEVTNAAATSSFAGGLTVGTNKLVIYSTGSTVGVGTASPETLFNVNGVARMGQSSAFFNEILDTTAGLRGRWTSDSAGRFRYQLAGDASVLGVSGSDSGALSLVSSGGATGTIYVFANNNSLAFRIGTSTDVAFFNNSGHFVPGSNNTYDLGGFGTGFFGAAWKDIYASGTIRFGATGGSILQGSSSPTGVTSSIQSNLAVGGRLTSSCSSGCVDLAEFFPASEAAEPGDILVVDREGNEPGTVRLSRAAHASDVVGVVSTNPAIAINGSQVILGGWGSEPRRPQVALSGRVPVKVSDEAGPIKIGDLLVTASLPGHAMRFDGSRLTSGVRPAVVGMALENFESGAGKIMVLVRTGWLSAQSLLGGTLRGQTGFGSNTFSAHEENGNLVINQDLDLRGRAILNVKSLSGADGKWRIDEDGNLITLVKTSHGDKELSALQNVTAKEVLLSGLANLSKGRSEIIFEPIDQEIIDGTVPLKVTVSLREPAQGLYVSESSGQGFTVKELNNGSSNANFSWMVIAKRRDNILVTTEPVASAPDSASTSSIENSSSSSTPPAAAVSSSTPVNETIATTTIASQ